MASQLICEQDPPRWFVGSSSNKIVGFMNKALASAIRIRHPPEKSRVFLACIFLVKPSPCKIWAARISAVAESIDSNLSYMRSKGSPPPSSCQYPKRQLQVRVCKFPKSSRYRTDIQLLKQKIQMKWKQRKCVSLALPTTQPPSLALISLHRHSSQPPVQSSQLHQSPVLNGKYPCVLELEPHGSLLL